MPGTSFDPAWGGDSGVIDPGALSVALGTSIVTPTGWTTPRTLPDIIGKDAPCILDIIPAGQHAAIAGGTTSYDCSTDFTYAFTQAGKVWVPKGTYRGNISVPQGGFIKGAGRDTTIFKPAVTNKPVVSVQGTDIGTMVRWWGLSDFKIDGENIVQPLVKLGWCGLGHMTNVRLFGAKDAGILCSAGVYDSLFDNLYINWCGRDDRTRGAISVEADATSGSNNLTFQKVDCETIRGPFFKSYGFSGSVNNNKIDMFGCKFESGAVGSETGLGDVIMDFKFSYQLNLNGRAIGWGNRDTSGGAIDSIVRFDSCGHVSGVIDAEIQSAYSPVSTYADAVKLVGTVYGYDLLVRWLTSPNDALMLNSSGVLMGGRPLSGNGGITHQPGLAALLTRDIRFRGAYNTGSSLEWMSNGPPSAGVFQIGDYVRNTAPSEQGTAAAKYVPMGWIKVTAGGTNTLGTDWQRCRSLTGN